MEYQIAIQKSCDILVLGGGGSGMVAAVRAAECSGKRVIVLEKAKRIGGSAIFASTMRTFGSVWQKKRNIPDCTGDFIRRVMDETYWRLDSQLVGNCIRGTGQFFDWVCGLEDGIEDQFEVGSYIFDGPNGQMGPQNGRQNNGSGRLVMELMEKKCAEFNVEVLVGHAAIDVIMDGERIASVIARCGDDYIKIECQACILATGSWINRREIVDKVCPAFSSAEVENNPHQNPNYTGDGIPLSEKAGAFIDYDSFCLRLMGPMFNSSSRVMNTIASSPYSILINTEGTRFVSEPMFPRMDPFDTGQVLLQQPRGLSYAIFDENTLREAVAASRQISGGGEGMPGPFYRYPETVEEIHAEMARGIDAANGYAIKGESLDDLAMALGVNPEGLRNTIERYNNFAASGFDWDFFKLESSLVPICEPPYYAVKGFLSTDGAFGGVRVNPVMQAYSTNEGLVDGLFVTGDFASGRFINIQGVKKQVLNDISWAFSSGFIAGSTVGKVFSGAE